MPVRVTVVKNDWAKAKTYIRRLDRMLKRDTDQYGLAGLRGAARVFDKNFKSEGGNVGGWPALKASTRAERESMGLGGDHPIMQRYEDLRMLTTTQLMTVRGSASFAKTDYEGGSIRVEVAPSRGVVNVTASGSKAGLQVEGDNRKARPYWFVDSHVLAAVKKEATFEIAKGIKRL